MKSVLDLDSGQTNAMTEVALALAMGFFSLMILTLVSMGAGEGPARPEGAEPADAIAAIVVTADQQARSGTAEPSPDDVFLMYWKGRFFDRAAEPVDPRSVQVGAASRLILAVDPGLPLGDVSKARAIFAQEDVIVAQLSGEWMDALAARGSVEMKTRRAVILICLASIALSGCARAAIGRPDSTPGKAAVKRIVLDEAGNMGVPPALALAVAHAESGFDPNALSHKGARGVMQIMPATAKGEYGIHPDALWDARLNVRVGLHFLNRLIRRYRGRTDLALSYYNGGSRVGRWPNARIIPATRPYVDRVLSLQSRYRVRLLRGEI